MPSSWTGTAEAYEVSFARLCAGTVEEMLRELGPADGRSVLDVGCGPGTVAAAARHAGFTAVELDADTSMLGLARRRHPAIPAVCGALPDLPFLDGQFDTVAANFVVNHTADPRLAVRELARVTRPGGRLVMTTWTATPGPMNLLWNDLLEAASVQRPPARSLPPDLDFERTTAGLAKLLVEADLAQVGVRRVDWEFRISPADLWRGVVGGIATIGQTYRAQRPKVRARMRAAYAELTAQRHPAGELRLPSSALLGRATVATV